MAIGTKQIKLLFQSRRNNTMKTQQELLQMLFSRLAELQDGRIKTVNPTTTKRLQTELNLLWDILIEDVPEEYWEQIEEEI